MSSKTIFRQSAMDRLSSPEQLDQVLRITKLRDWLLLVAVFLVSTAAVVWGFKGTVATEAHGQGVIVRSGGVLNVVTQGGGLVLELDAQVGQQLKADQRIAVVAQPALVEKLAATQKALTEAVDDRARALELRKNSLSLQVELLQRQATNTSHEIQQSEDEARILNEQVSAQERLLRKGLVTKEQVLQVLEKLTSIQNHEAALRAQLKQYDSQKFTIESQLEMEDMERKSRISSLQRDAAAVAKELSLAENVISPYSGQVLELKVSPGSAVTVGQPVLSIQPEVESLELVAYIPSSKAKEAKVGMEAQVSPSTVRREEFGFMRGKITYVSDYPATHAALMRNFENESLAQDLGGSGPVTEVRIALNRDPLTSSGFQWSGLQAPDVQLTSGTLCTVEVITRRQRPISLLFPFLKNKLGVS
jgi:HlyD family secretion protein